MATAIEVVNKYIGFIAWNIDVVLGVYPIFEYPRLLIDISGVTSLKGFYIDQNLVINAGTTLTELIEIFDQTAKTDYFEYLKILNDHLQLVAHIPVRNVSI